jgi:tripartite-type tricarboxylate transporter receptor subunit TctC
MQVGSIPKAAAAATVALLVGSPAAAASDSVADFYRGKTVQLVIPSNMGGSVGLYGKLVTDHIGRHIPGQPNVILIQMPGAGGLQSVEFMSQVAPKDGTAFGEILSPSLLVPLLRNTRFDPNQLQWLGSLTARPGVVAVWHTAAATTLEGAKKTELAMGSTGVGSGNYWIPTLSNAVLGTKFKLVTGYRGGADINLAIERREIDGRSNYWTGWTTVKSDWIREGKLKFLFRTGPKAPDMPNLPAFEDLVSGPERQMVQILDAPDAVGVGFYMPSGVPAERAAALRKAFWETMHDPKFLAEAKRLKAPIAPVPADELQKVVASIYSTPPAVVERLKQVIIPKK